MREVFRMVESETIYVVPVFISEGYFTQTVIPRELELTGARTLRGSRTIYYCDPVGSHPGMTEALDQLRIEIETTFNRRGIWGVNGKAYVGDTLVTEAALKATFADSAT